MLFEGGTGFCPWHKRDSSFEVVHHIPSVTPYFQSPYGAQNIFEREEQRGAAFTGLVILQCLHCKKAVVLLEATVVFPSEDPQGMPEIRQWRTMVSPDESPRTLHESAPEEVRSLFAEASRCEKAKALRAAGVMYRAAVEELVKEQGATGPNLYQKIDSLKGKWPDELIEDLHEARMLGNDSIHDGLTYSEAEVADVAQLIEEAILVLYVQPEQKRAMREARKARRDGSKP